MSPKIKLLDFIRHLFKEVDQLSYNEICEKVKQNEENLLDIGKDHKHKVRQRLFYLKEYEEIASIKRGIYKTTKKHQN